MGVDPGFAFTGIAVLREVAGALRLVHCETLVTETPTKKARAHTRASTIDMQRMVRIYKALQRVLDTYHPQAVGVETYAPFKQRLGGNAWKTAFAYALACGLCIEREVLCFPSTPQDLKRQLLGTSRGSKEEIWDAVRQQVGNLQALDAVKLTLREHATDAVGHAVLAYREVREWGKYAY